MDELRIDSAEKLTIDIEKLTLFPEYAKGKAQIIDLYVKTYLSILSNLLVSGIEEGAFHDALATFYDSASTLQYVAVDTASTADPSISNFRETLLECDTAQKTV